MNVVHADAENSSRETVVGKKVGVTPAAGAFKAELALEFVAGSCGMAKYLGVSWQGHQRVLFRSLE